MIRRWLACAACLLLLPSLARAHLSSPDVFFDGNIGPYPAHVSIRMPTVIPARAEISVQVQAPESVDVSFSPLFSKTAIFNAPPPDVGLPVRGETNLYSGDLWLMTSGAYSIEVKIHGAAGEGSVEIPVTSVAISQLPLPNLLGGILVALGAVLVLGGLAIVVGAARESVLLPGVVPQKRNYRNGILAGTITLVIFTYCVWGGLRWWASDEKEFRARLLGGAYPDMDLAVNVDGSQRIMELTLGRVLLTPDDPVSLLPDHGKLLHLFLIREGSADAIGHIHPVRKEGKTFQVALPPLPEGRYKVYCDLTSQATGMSFTATNSVQIPAVPTVGSNTVATLEPDPDDSWASYAAESVPAASSTNQVFNFPNGLRVAWKPHPPLRVHHDAGLQFEIADASGNAVSLEPYMGMSSHAAVMRRDGSIFAHLHPSGNYSMAAQMYFMKKMANEAKSAVAAMPGMMHEATSPGERSVISLPYEFPVPGDYRIWVQFKTGGQVMTTAFDATVAP